MTLSPEDIRILELARDKRLLVPRTDPEYGVLRAHCVHMMNRGLLVMVGMTKTHFQYREATRYGKS